jgi:hypothetical protein
VKIGGKVTMAFTPRATAQLKTSFSLAVHTARVPRKGRHLVDVIVNGSKIRAGAFAVV